MVVSARVNFVVFYAERNVFFRGLEVSIKPWKCKIALRFLSSRHDMYEKRVVRKFNCLQL